MNKFRPIDMANISSIHGVLAELRRLDTELLSCNLGQFHLFNTAYLLITTLLIQALDDEYFDNPQYIQAFLVLFAHHYFTAVNNTTTGQDIPPAWAKLNDEAHNKQAPTFISLMMGANAHITNDLPFVLHTFLKHKHIDDIQSDLAKISKLLMLAGKQVIDTFEEDNNVLDFLKRHFRFLYYRPAMYTILYWRLQALKSYKNLKNDANYKKVIIRKSTNIADNWLRLSKLLTRV